MKPLNLKIKRTLTLIEVVLSMGLVALLLTSLVFLTSYMWRSQTRVREIRKQVLAKELLWTRLEDCLSRLLVISSVIQKKEGDSGREIPISLISNGREVSFSYRPLVGGPYEINTVRQARLYLEDECLMFESIPSPLLCDSALADELSEKQIWLQNVDQMRLFFLYLPELKPPSKFGLTTDASTNQPQEGWNEVWLKEWEKPPQGIVVELTQGSKVEKWPIWLQAGIAHYLPREELGEQE